MSEFTPLREAVDTLASRTPSPDFGELKRRATRRGRRRVVMVAAAAAAVIVGRRRPSPASPDGTTDADRGTHVGQPTPVAHGAGECRVAGFLQALGQSWTHYSTWSPAGPSPRPATYPEDYDYALNGPCSGDWDEGAISGGDGGIFGTSLDVGHGKAGFSSEAQASDAAAEFVENLASCTATAWRTQPIPQTGAVLASSDHAVAWIQEGHREVHVLQAPTIDGPPPASVQVAVAEWLVAYITEENTD